MPLFEKGREAFLGALIDFDTDTIKAMLARLTTEDTMVQNVEAASNATPIVITITAHGWTNGDLVLIDGVGGNLAANGIWKIASVLANSFELQRPDGVNASGSGVFTSGGYAVNLTATDFIDDLSATRVSTDQTLTTPTITNGVADAADPTWTAVASGAALQGFVLYKDTGAEATSRAFFIHIGKHIVTVAADAAISATTVVVEPLEAPIANGTVLVFSNGQSATLSAAATDGARTLTVSALAAAINAGNRAFAPADVTLNFPITPNGGNITVQFDAGADRIFKL